MLKLQKLQVQLAKPLFPPTSRKYLRISIGSIAKTTTQPAKLINDQALQWTEPLSFPLLYNKQFMFEIFDKHQFGYNPEELQTILQGSFTIDSLEENKGTWEIFTGGGQRIGFLSANIVSKVSSMIVGLLGQKKTTTQTLNQTNQTPLQSTALESTPTPNNKQLRISSIVARAPTLNIKKAYIAVQVGQKVVKTGQLKSRTGELVCIESKKIQLEPNDTDANIKIYSIRPEGEEVLVSEGVLQLIGTKPSKKVILMKDGQEVGQLYIQSKIVDKNQINNSSYVTNKNKSLIYEQNNESYVSNSFAAEQQINQRYVKPRTKSISPSRSIDYTRLEDFGINPGANQSRISKYNPLDSSLISSMSARGKKSVVNQNNNIIFPKQKRFMIYQDRQNDRVTYLNDRSFQFKSQHSGRFYRGASIGYGGKTDFTRQRKANPGVGNYKLPSIWDRY